MEGRNKNRFVEDVDMWDKVFIFNKETSKSIDNLIKTIKTLNRNGKSKT